VPTFREAGYADLLGEGWFGMYAPSGTPAATIKAVNEALNKALVHPGVQERFAKLALEAGGGSPADLEARTAQDIKRWAPVVKATGFRGD
jgi:tripartite-type tricarboxylate transporter receptor subunit TctC